ncbi:MAG: DNA cytosine methyltransferase [Candidatus Kuenenia stuttgartiensis]|nr:DNA cytosine methyltransferase [Candidatus Kuenenia stuttgartiensis]
MYTIVSEGKLLMKAITLFSSAGIGDLAIKKHGIEILVANEIVESRVALHRQNFPETVMIQGDIWAMQETIVTKTLERLQGDELDFVFATPPCQGMSKNGQGKLLRGIRDGLKPKLDERNQLIIPTLQIIKKLKPRTVFLENVPEMIFTVILDENGQPVNIIDYIKRELGNEYVGKPEVVQFADYGIPQRRSRLITIYSRDEKLKAFFSRRKSFIPEKTHSNEPNSKLKPWVTVRDVIGNLPPLDGKNKRLATSNIPFHRVAVLDPKKYFWISNTPPEKGAFDNQCINPKCGYQGNPTHGSSKDHHGINRANGHTPLYCEKCGELLPRPYTIEKDGTKRIMAGYTSAYKRMSWDLPAPTLTTNLSYPSSDHKLHPEQNRVLSLYEAFLLHTLNEFNYDWRYNNNDIAPDTVIAEVIGESIPPKAIYLIVGHLLSVLADNEIKSPIEYQLSFLD